MAPEIRFNAMGIPYLVEFANVAFNPSRQRSSSRASTRTLASSRGASCSSRPSLSLRPSFTSSRTTLASDWTLAPAASASSSSETLTARGSYREKKGKDSDTASLASTYSYSHSHPDTEHGPGQGLYIRFASQLAQPPRKLSETRLARMKYRIAKAVLAAGMDSSPAAVERGDPMDSAASAAAARASISSIRSEDVEREGLPGSLFRGTYGQVTTALRAAGLATVPCTEAGVQDATRLGALFVAHPNERGGVDFTRLTLWA